MATIMVSRSTNITDLIVTQATGEFVVIIIIIIIIIIATTSVIEQ